MIQLPLLPTAPGPGSTAEDRASFYDQVAAYDLLLRTIALQQAEAAQTTREAHAQAQAETAAAMRASLRHEPERESKRGLSGTMAWENNGSRKKGWQG
jgi:hypothetical protein